MTVDLTESQLARLGIALQLLLGQTNITSRDLATSLLSKYENNESETVLTTILVQQILKNDTLTTSDVVRHLSRFPDLPRSNNALVPASILIALGCISALTVLLRLYSRAVFTGRIRVEDWVIFFTLFLGLSMTVHYNVMARAHGVGDHVWDNNFVRVRTALLMAAWVFSEVYLIAISLVKLSFLVFYYHLGQVYRGFRWAVISTAGFIVSWLVVQLVIIIRICTPINYWDHLITAKCMDRMIVYFVASTVNIVQDIVILLLPIYIVRRLSLSPKEKLLVMSLFGLGGTVCIISISKMFFVRHASKSFDFTHSQTIFNMLSQIEVHLGIICCSIPSLRSLFSRSRQRISAQFNLQFHHHKKSTNRTTGASSTVPSAAHFSHLPSDNSTRSNPNSNEFEISNHNNHDDVELSPRRPSDRYMRHSSDGGGVNIDRGLESSSTRLQTQPRMTASMHIASFEDLERQIGGIRQASEEGEGDGSSKRGPSSDSIKAQSNKSSTGTQRSIIARGLRRVFTSGS